MFKPVWIGLIAIALTLCTALGALLGSVNLSQGTTMTVVTGMGAILGSGWLSRRFIDWVEPRQPEAWETISVQTGYILGSINLAVAMVVGFAALWRVAWPQQDWPWPLIGGVLGLLGAIFGGLFAAKAVAEAE